MTTRKPWTTLAALIFLLMALVHLYRLVSPFDILIGGTALPQSVSIAGLVIAGLLSLMLLRESNR